MKKFWTIILAVGLVMAIVMPAAAADVKFSGSYYARGWAVSNPTMLDKGDTSNPGSYKGSTSFYDQRLRVSTEVKVVEGLRLTTKFDAMERKWGKARTTYDATGANYSTVEQENISFEEVSVEFLTPIGQFRVGSWTGDPLGTPFF
jgi:hypothetical protein